jgi:hypothetical protein
VKPIEIYADSRGISTCRGERCGQRILWAEVAATGRRMCFNDLELPALKTRRESATNRLIETVDLDDNHWSTCKDREKFSRPKPQRQMEF